MNAIDSSGTNCMFSKLADHGETERLRHDEAIEKLRRYRDTWVKESQERLDLLIIDYRKRNMQKKTFKYVNEAMQAYYHLCEKSDYYHPPEKQKNGEIIFILGWIIRV